MNRRGSTTLIELLAVCGLIALLAPLVIGLMVETHQRLSPGGPAGLRVMAVQSASSALEAIQADLDRSTEHLRRLDEYRADRGDLILALPESVVVWRREGTRLLRIRLDLRTGGQAEQLRCKGVEGFTVVARDPSVLRMTLRAGSSHPGSPVRTYATVWDRRR